MAECSDVADITRMLRESLTFSSLPFCRSPSIEELSVLQEKAQEVALQFLLGEGSSDSQLQLQLDFSNQERMFEEIESYDARFGKGSLSKILGTCKALFPQHAEPPPRYEHNPFLFFSMRTPATTLNPEVSFDNSRLMATLKVLSVEHYLFRALEEVIWLKKIEIESRRQLCAAGYHYPSFPGVPCSFRFPPYLKTLSWPILFLRCKLANISGNTTHFEANAERFKDLIARILRAEERFPDFRGPLQDFFIEAKNFECTARLCTKWESVIATLDELVHEKNLGSTTIEWPAALAFFLEWYVVWKQRLVVLRTATTARTIQSLSDEERMALSEQWDELFIDFEKLYTDALAVYRAAPNRETTRAVYSNAYTKMDQHLKGLYGGRRNRRIARRGCGIREFCVIATHYPLFSAAQLSFPELATLCPEAIPRVIPEDERLIVLQMRVDFHERSKRESTPQGDFRREFLPEYLLKQSVSTGPRTSQKSKKKSHKKLVFDHAAVTPPVVLLSELKAAPSLACAASAITCSSAATLQKKLKEVISIPRPLAEEVALVEDPEVVARFPIQIGEGPGNFRYNWSVLKWTFDNPFVTDASYRDCNFSPEVRAAILLEHNFAHVIHKLCIFFGARYEKKSDEGVVESVTYVLPGEGYWDEAKYEKMIFEICINPTTKKIFHAYATNRTPFQLVQRYARNRCFREDAAEDIPEAEGEDAQRLTDLLPDDGSRVTDFHLNTGHEDGEEFFEVRDPKFCVTYKLYRFPVY